MRKWLNRFQINGLFIKLFLVTVISIAAVSVLVTWSTIRLSERLFIDTFSIINSKVLSQINSGFQSLNTAIVTASNNMLQSGSVKQYLTESDGDSLTMAKSYYNMRKQMDQIATAIETYETAIIVKGINGRTYMTNRLIWPIAEADIDRHPVTLAAHEDPKRLLYLADFREADGAEPVIIAAKAMMERSTGFVYGTLFFAMRESEFKQLYSSYTSEGNDMVILDRSGTILSSNRGELIGRQVPELLGIAEDMHGHGRDYASMHLFGRNQIVLAEYLPFNDLYMVNLIDKQSILNTLVDTRTITLIVIGIVAGALIIVYMISRRLTRSLTRLVKQISNISKYEFGHYVSETGSYETRQLARAFNFMLDELKEYLAELDQAQRKKRNAELAALQRQINPHFLYNTLASIKIMVKQGSREKASETINALIALLQNAIGDVSETITVERDIELLRHYALIMEARNGDRIKLHDFVAPDCRDALVPKLMIQPFVENAFFHAFNRKAEGSVYVTVSRKGNTLVCEIVDNGDGMELDGGWPESKSRSRGHLFTGIGMRNVHERLTLLYGEPYGVQIQSRAGEGTTVRIELPYRTAKNIPSIQKSS
jgi:two-component system sensor histidine kinase YesM